MIMPHHPIKREIQSCGSPNIHVSYIFIFIGFTFY